MLRHKESKERVPITPELLLLALFLTLSFILVYNSKEDTKEPLVIQLSLWCVFSSEEGGCIYSQGGNLGMWVK